MYTFRTILFAADFSVRSEDSFRVARALAQEPGTRLVVLHVVVPVLFQEAEGAEGAAGFPVFFPSNTPSHRKELEEKLHAAYPADSQQSNVEYLVRDGEAEKVIPRTAVEVGADLIVLGTHGRTGLDRLLDGSVAEAVLRQACCPVVAVRSTDQARLSDAIRVIVHPTDFSERSEAARRLARSLARSHGARLVLLHVIPAPHVSAASLFDHHDHGDDPELLAKLEVQTAGPDLKQPVETRLVHGDPAALILQTAEELHSDLIVMGSHGRSGLTRQLLGSVAEAVVRQAPCPALVIKTSGHAPAASESSGPAGESAPPRETKEPAP